MNMLSFDIIFLIGKFLQFQDYLIFSEVSKTIRKALTYGRLEGESKTVVKYFNKQRMLMKKIINDILEYPKNIKKYPNAPLYIRLLAINKNEEVIKYIDNPPEQVQLAAVTRYGCAIQFIKNPSVTVQLAAVNKHGYAIQFIKDPSEDVKLAAVKKTGCAIQFIEDPSEEVQLAAVEQDGFSIFYIKIGKICKILR